jgi:hypothetical protein
MPSLLKDVHKKSRAVNASRYMGYWASQEGLLKETDFSPRPMAVLILEHASASQICGEWNDHDYDVLADRAVVGRIMRANAVPVGAPWLWTVTFGHHEDCTRPTAMP